MKDWLLLMCAHMLLRVRLLLACNGWPASMRTNKCENLAWEWDEKNPPPLLSSIRFKSSMFTHAKVLWSWGVTCENCPSRVYIYPSCWSLSSFQIGLSWQEEEFKMFSLAAISIKAWLSFPKYFFSSFLSWLEGKEGQKQCACNQRKREQSFGPWVLIHQHPSLPSILFASSALKL